MWNFLKTAFFRGILVLVPIVILWFTFRELMEMMVLVATPIADLFPEDTFDHENETEIIAVILIVGSAVILGTLGALNPIRKAARWLENRTLNQLPMYRMLQSFMAAFLGMENEDNFRPALLTNDDGNREPVYVIEDKGYDQVVVMQPWTPTPFAGSLKIVPKGKVELLPISLDEFSLSLTHFGLGLADIVVEHSEA